MSFQMVGGSAANNDYDYESGSGMDSFLSRSIDEVSWQTNLGTTYNSLSQLPIGVYPTQATPQNYDLSAVSGSQGGTQKIGNTAVAQSGQVNTKDSNGNTVLQVGTLT